MPFCNYRGWNLWNRLVFGGFRLWGVKDASGSQGSYSPAATYACYLPAPAAAWGNWRQLSCWYGQNVLVSLPASPAAWRNWRELSCCMTVCPCFSTCLTCCLEEWKELSCCMNGMSLFLYLLPLLPGGIGENWEWHFYLVYRIKAQNWFTQRKLI